MDYSMGPVETRVLKSEARGRRGGQNDAMVSTTTIDSFEEEDTSPRNISKLQKLENAKNGFSLRALKKRFSLPAA